MTPQRILDESLTHKLEKIQEGDVKAQRRGLFISLRGRNLIIIIK